MATKGTKVPSVYKVPSKADPELKLFAESIKEAVEVRLGRRGDPRDRAITLRELIDSGMAQELTDNPFDPNTGVGPTDFEGTTVTDYTIPPTPTGFTATATYTSFVLAWDNPQMGNFAYTEVWRSADSSIGNAIKVDSTPAFVWSEEVGYNKTYHYWVRHVSTSEIKGQYSVSRSGTTSIDIGAVMTNLSETLADLPGYSAITSLVTQGAGEVIRSSGAPTTRSDGSSALTINDIWYDTDDGNISYRNAANNAWVAARDATLVNTVGTASYTGSSLTAAMASAQGDVITLTDENTARSSEITNLTSTVSAKTQTFVASSAPTAVATGDLWVDTSSNNALKRWNGSNWVAVRDTTNDGKTTVFTQTSQPTANNTGDIWFDTNSSPANKQYRWDGSNWVEVRDVTSQAAISSEATTRATADSANATAITTLETNTNTALGTKATTASVTAVQNALSNGTSAQAGYGVAVNANGAVAGMYIMANSSGTLQNNTSTTNIIFEAGQVTIRNPYGSNMVPFTVLTSTDGAGNPAGVYIDQAYIKDASIAAAKIGSLSANLVNAVAIDAGSIDAGFLDAARINTNTITTDKLAFGSGTVVTSSGSGANAILTIANNGIILDHISANAIGKVANMVVNNVSRTNSTYTFSSLYYQASTPWSEYTVSAKGGPTTNYLGNNSSPIGSLTLNKSSILESGEYLMMAFIQPYGTIASSSANNESALHINVYRSTNGSSWSYWSRSTTGTRSGGQGFHLSPLVKYAVFDLSSSYHYRFDLWFHLRGFSDVGGSGYGVGEGAISVMRLNKTGSIG